MKKILPLFIIIIITAESFAQLSPEITSWKINTTGTTAYAGILSNVQTVQYSANWVYVSCTCIPDYNIGPWPTNPNAPSNQNFVFKITRNPVQNTGTPVATPMGHIGLWSNGVSMFNAKDGMSYNGMGIWNQNAVVVEGISFDTCLGHPAPNGEYHLHLNPRCLYDDTDSLNHSPIIGYAFDGFPIYGAYSFTNTNGTGPITRMKSSFRLRSITTRTTLPDGTPLSPPQYGPNVSATYPLGYYLEDYEYISGLGDLDEHNGRICITPEYPAGIFCYFVTLDPNQNGIYPYTLGPAYYGTVPPGNTGPGSGHNTITETVTTYNPLGIETAVNEVSFSCFPNPTDNYMYVSLDVQNENNLTAFVMNSMGQVMEKTDNLQPSITYTFDFSSYPSGVYFVKVQSENGSSVKQVVITK